MPTVSLNPPLRDLADGRRRIEIDGSTVRDVIRALERSYPRLTGWVLDEHGAVRPHVNVFVNSEVVRRDQVLQSEISGDAEICIMPAVSGGTEPLAVARPLFIRTGTLA